MYKQKREDKELRNALLGQIHIAKKGLGLDDDTYRDVIEQATKYRSAAHCSINQLYDIINIMNDKGADIKPARRYKKPQYSLEDLQKYCGNQKPKNEQESMVFGLWVDICKAKKAHNPSFEGLRGLCLRSTMKVAPRFCNGRELSNLIEALKEILRRPQNAK